MGTFKMKKELKTKGKCYLFNMYLSSRDGHEPMNVVRVWRFDESKMADECYKDALKMMNKEFGDKYPTIRLSGMSPIV